jgi:hypothetical protein
MSDVNPAAEVFSSHAYAEKPPKSEALSDWSKFPHIDIFEASTFLEGLLPLNKDSFSAKQI